MKAAAGRYNNQALVHPGDDMCNDSVERDYVALHKASKNQNRENWNIQELALIYQAVVYCLQFTGVDTNCRTLVDPEDDLCYNSRVKRLWHVRLFQNSTSRSNQFLGELTCIGRHTR